jgi:type I restriction enzyme S subunit
MDILYHKLKDCCSKIGSGATPKGGKSVYTDEGVSLIRSQNVYNLSFSYKGLAHITDEAAKKLSGVTIQENDVLLNITGDSVARTCVVPNDVLPARVNQHVAIIRPNKSLDPTFLNYYLASPAMQGYLLNIASTGASRNAITKAAIEKLIIPAPKIDEQHKIASLLSSYNNLIENNNKRIKILEQMAENLYKEWFVRFRFPGHETTPIENGIPKGWELKHISEIGDVIGGGTPSTEKDEYWNGNIPWLSPADLSDFQGIYIGKGANNITELGLAKSSAKIMPKDTVLLSSRAPIGYVALAKNDICTNQGFKSVVCNTQKIKPSYLYLNFKLNRTYLQNFASGATFPELSGSMVKKIKVLVPSISLLEKFDTLVRPLFEKTDILLSQNQNLIKQRDLLLPRLMSGKLAV